MQTTLLGFAIAIILALVAALVGPIFIDWGRYRGEFEARASRLTGLDFRVTGAIDARLLPTPTLMLQGVEFGRPNEGSKVRARALRIEFALGALVRGAWRIADARLEGPELTAGLDPTGHLSWPVPKLGFDLEGVAIERLNIEDGRAVLVDAASNSRLVLDKMEFHGELRSLAGPVKGDGSFVVAGQHYPYSVSTSRIADDGGVKVRLAVNPVDLPLTAEADLTILIERGTPRFEGSIQVARAVGRAPAGAPSLIINSWRVTSRVKGRQPRRRVLDQIELQYGPDDRAIKLKGNANLTFGRQPEVNGVLSSPQIDLDRVLGLPEATRRRPLVAIKTLAESFISASRLPIPTTLSISVENVTLGGAMLARVGADLKVDADGVDIRRLELRAPGVTQVRVSGRLRNAATGARFEGTTRIEANDPRGLIAWLTDRTEQQAAAVGPWRLGADVTLGSDSIAIEQLKLELDRLNVDGRMAYAWASDERPARLDAAITAPEIDLDRINALGKALLGDAAFDWPRDVTLSLKVGRAIVAGLEAKQTDVNMRIGANGIEIDKLAIADFAGASLAVKAQIDTKAQPHGTMTLDFDARTLDGLLVLLEKSAPQAADQLRRSAGRLTPLTMRASLAVDPGAAGSTAATATFKIDGRAGVSRLALQGDVGTASDGGKLDIAALGAAQMNVSGRVDADEGAALMDLIGLDRFIAVDKRPGRLTLTAKGQLGGDLVVDSQLAVGALGISANGSMRVSGGAGPSAGLNLKIVNANIRSPRTLPADRPAELLPTSVSASVDLTDETLFTEVAGTVAGTKVAGRVVLRNQQPMTLDGDIELGTLDLPAAIAVAIGIPTQSAGANVSTGAGALGRALGLWPAEPFERGLLRLGGQLSVKAAQVPLTAKLVARDVRGVLRIGESQLALQVIDGSMAGGRMGGELVFLRHGDGLIARSRIRLTDANAAEMFPGDGLISGRFAFDLSAEGTGMSAGALIGSLEGGGRFTLENGRLARLDPAAFEAVMRAVDRGLPVNAISVRERLESALASGALAIARAEGPIVINAGQARLSNTVVRAQGADLTVGGSVDLAEGTLEARLLLFGPGGAGSPINTRPEITIALKGPINAPKRTIDAAALANWLALRAVEQQSKKLDVLEGREASPPPAPPAVNSNTQPAPN